MSAPEVTAAVERLAKALAQLEPDEPWPTNAELGGSLTGTRDDEFRDGKRDEARELLADLLDFEEMAQELHRHLGLNMPWVNLTQTEKAYYRDKAADLRAALLGDGLKSRAARLTARDHCDGGCVNPGSGDCPTCKAAATEELTDG